MNRHLPDLIEKNKELINQNKFEEVYQLVINYLDGDLTKDFTELLLSCDINPLQYMNSVPSGYLMKSKVPTEIKLPDNIEYIGSAAFYNCPNLTKVEMGNNVVTIAHNVFYDDINLSSIQLSNKLKVISDAAFKNCESLTEITLPATLEKIFPNAFSGCKIERVYLEDLESYLKCIISNPYSSPFYGGEAECYVGTQKLVDLVIPESITEVNDYAFLGCYSIESVHIHKGVTRIGNGAFDDCGQLMEVYYDGTKEELRNILESVLPLRVMVYCSDGEYSAEDLD